MSGRTQRFEDLEIDEDVLYEAMQEAARTGEPPRTGSGASDGATNRSRSQRWSARLLGLVGSAGMVIAAAAAMIGTQGNARMVAAGLVIIGALAVMVLLAGGIQRSSERRAIRAALNRRGFRLCVECGYSLQGLPEGLAACPECGEACRPAEPETDSQAPG